MNARILLCDMVQAAEGKLYVLGGGWTITGPGPTTMGVAILIEVDWGEANERHAWHLALLDQDGRPVTLPGPEEHPVGFGDSFEVGRPPGLPHGVSLNIPLAVNVQSMPLPPGGRFVWELTIDDETRDHWRASFSTRPGP